MTIDRIGRRKRSLARALERAVVPERLVVCSVPYIIDPRVADACASPLRAIATALRNENHEVADAILGELRSFVHDGGTSPYFGRDADAARLEARRLEQLVASGAT